LRAEADDAQGKRVIGTIMGKLFSGKVELEVDGFVVVRDERCVGRDDPLIGGGFKSKTYLIRNR